MQISIWIVIVSILGSIAEYSLIYSVRKTSAFIFTSTLALITPITYILELVSKEMFNTNCNLKFEWYYIVAVFIIVCGCILCHYSSCSDKHDEKLDIGKKLKHESATQLQKLQCNL